MNPFTTLGAISEAATFDECTRWAAEIIDQYGSFSEPYVIEALATGLRRVRQYIGDGGFEAAKEATRIYAGRVRTLPEVIVLITMARTYHVPFGTLRDLPILRDYSPEKKRFDEQLALWRLGDQDEQTSADELIWALNNVGAAAAMQHFHLAAFTLINLSARGYADDARASITELLTQIQAELTRENWMDVFVSGTIEYIAQSLWLVQKVAGVLDFGNARQTFLQVLPTRMPADVQEWVEAQLANTE